jgi:exodeoxyribonuclease VIII
MKLVENILAEEYDKRPGIRSTFLREIIGQSVIHALTPSKETPSLEFGQAAHCYILENQKFHRQYAFAPEGDKRKTEVKAAWKEFEEVNAGKTYLEKKNEANLLAMRSSVLYHPIAVSFLDAANRFELSFFSQMHGVDVLKFRIF